MASTMSDYNARSFANVVAGDNVWVPFYEPKHNENIVLAIFLAKGHANCIKDFKCEEGYACNIFDILCPGNAGCCAYRKMRKCHIS